MKHNKPVIILAGRNDRATIACLRSFERADIKYEISLPANRESKLDPYNVVWKLSPYRNKITSHNYHPIENPDKFIKSLEKLRNSRGGFILYPIGEAEMRTILENINKIGKLGIEIGTVDIDTFLEISNKDTFTDLCRNYEIPIPKEIPYQQAKNNLPFVAKPKYNITEDGRKITPYLIFNKRELDIFNNKEDKTDFFYQEFIQGTPYYYCSLWNDGEIVSKFTQQTIRQQPNGKSVFKASPANISNSILEKSNSMLNDLNWNGPIMIEFKLTGGDYYAIEANPRFWGPLQLAVDNGVDFPTMLYNQMTNSDKPTNTAPNKPKGYRWSTGYLNGLWMKYFNGGQFAEHTDEGATVDYNDVWLRKDTILNHYLYDLVGQGLTPASVVLYDRR